MASKNKGVALFIDNKNMYRSLKEMDSNFKPKALGQKVIEEFGEIVIGKTYWGLKANGLIPGRKIKNLYKLGIQVVPVPQYRDKDFADGKIMVDVLNYLTRYPNIDKWIIVSNDKDFLPLLQEIKRNDKEVILIHCQDIPILRDFCQTLGIRRFLYQDIIE